MVIRTSVFRLTELSCGVIDDLATTPLAGLRFCRAWRRKESVFAAVRRSILEHASLPHDTDAGSIGHSRRCIFKSMLHVHGPRLSHSRVCACPSRRFPRTEEQRRIGAAARRRTESDSLRFHLSCAEPIRGAPIDRHAHSRCRLVC